MQNTTRRAGAGPTCCGEEALSRPQVNTMPPPAASSTLAIRLPSRFPYPKFGRRPKGRKRSEAMKLIPEDFLTEEPFAALWHVLGANPPSRLAAGARAMPRRRFAPERNAAALGVWAGSRPPPALPLPPRRGTGHAPRAAFRRFYVRGGWPYPDI